MPISTVYQPVFQPSRDVERYTPKKHTGTQKGILACFRAVHTALVYWQWERSL